MKTSVSHLFLLLITAGTLLFSACSDAAGNEANGTITIRLSGGTGRAVCFAGDSYTDGDLGYDVKLTNTSSGAVVTAAVTTNAGTTSASASIAPGSWQVNVKATLVVPPNGVYALGAATFSIAAGENKSVPIQMKRPVTVTFDSGGGSAVSGQIVPDGGKVERPADPAKSGYIFDDWYTTNAYTAKWDFALDTVSYLTSTSAPYTLYAKWDLPSLSIETTSVSYTDSTANAITPINVNVGTPTAYDERIATITVAVSGFIDDVHANGVGLNITAVTGLTFSGNTVTGDAVSGTKTFTITVTYNGTQAFTSTSQTITITGLSGIPTGYTNPYAGGNVTTSVTIYDGQGAGREIPVSQRNVQAFNAYANTTAGLSKYYRQIENITLTAGASNWTAIGRSSPNFTGSYDGGGHTISNLTIIMSSDNNQGIFGIISGANAVVKNLGLVNCSIIGNNSVGGVAGGANSGGTIQNCYVTGSISGTSGEVGGVVGGANSGTIESCYVTGSVSGTEKVGGVIGYSSAASVMVQNCYATGNVSGTTGSGIGGVVGYNYGTAKNCYATGNVSNTAGLAVGGVAGEGNTGTLQNCIALVLNITSNSSFFGRVVGFAGTKINNFGRNDMTRNNVTPTTWTNKGSAALDGDDITSAEWGDADWWENTALFDPAVWEFGGIDGTKLPTLKGMPSGAQNPVIQY